MLSFTSSGRHITLVAVALAAVLATACQRKETPTPAATGTMSNPPAAAASAVPLPPTDQPGTMAPAQPASTPGS